MLNISKPTDYYEDGGEYAYAYDEDYYDSEGGDFGEENLCQLPKELGGFGKFIS